VARHSRPSGPNLRPFLEAVDQLLNELSHSELKARLRARARELPPEQRNEFLALLRRSATPNHTEPGRASKAARDLRLMDDIHHFTEELSSGQYVDDWGWDPEIGDERFFGDESWVDEMDELFARAGDVFLQQDYRLAAEAYGSLLEAFLLSEEGVFSGQTTPEEMVETNIAEAKARYLRALYVSSTPDERVPLLLDAVRTLVYVGPADVGLRAVLEADDGPLWMAMAHQRASPGGRGAAWGRRRPCANSRKARGRISRTVCWSGTEV